MITDNEIIELASRQYPNELWQKAFMFYNQNNNEKLNIGCKSCFGKVLAYILQIRFKNKENDNV